MGLKSDQRALEIRVKVLGEEHPDTAQSYFNLGITQHASGDFLSAHQSSIMSLRTEVLTKRRLSHVVLQRD